MAMLQWIGFFIFGTASNIGEENFEFKPVVLHVKIDFVLHLVSLFGFYGISTFVGYSTPNPFLYKWTVLFQTIQFNIST